MSSFEVRAAQPRDREWARQLLVRRWRSTRIVTRGRIHQADELPAFIAESSDGYLGLATYRFEADECELVTLNSLVEGQRIGTALVDAVKDSARAAGCRRLWLIATNDNLRALGFYQKRGFVLAAVHRDALERSRELKPEIPRIGMDGIPLRDEIELEMLL